MNVLSAVGEVLYLEELFPTRHPQRFKNQMAQGWIPNVHLAVTFIKWFSLLDIYFHLVERDNVMLLCIKNYHV